jgi:hypothetical protein
MSVRRLLLGYYIVIVNPLLEYFHRVRFVLETN